MTATSSGADLQQLMAIADRYARTLVANAGPPSTALLIERAGELDIVLLVGQDRATAAQVRRLLAQHQATSAALLVETRLTSGDATHPGVCILGEAADGTIDERRYRVRPCGWK